MQKVVVKNCKWEFSTECRELLNDGWMVIPGTVVVSVAEGNSSAEAYVAFFTDGEDE